MLTRKLTRRITQEITRAITSPGVGGGVSFTPDASFFAGAAGYAYDPFDYSTMFQDSAGTTPVTGNAQSLGRINDLSGNGSNRVQATLAAKPQTDAKGYLTDGFDDKMESTVDLDLAGTWTHIIKLEMASPPDGRFVIISGGAGGAGYFLYGETGSPGGMGSVTVVTTEIDGVSTLSAGAIASALNTAGQHVAVNKISAFVGSQWNDKVNLTAFASGEVSIYVGREILINRDLTGTELSDAIAWVNG